LRRTRLFEETIVGLQSVSVRESVAQSERILAYQLRKKGLTMKNTIGPDLFVVAERVSFVNFVLNNPLSNAIKYSHPGGTITVEAHLDARIVHIVIRDTGIGIDSSKCESIFEAFKQEDGTTTRKYGGTGLGLSITKHIISEHNGEILCQNIPEKGANFKIRLPAMKTV